MSNTEVSAAEIERLKEYVGRSISETDMVDPHVPERFAATLDVDFDGDALPALWHYGLFLVKVPTSRLGPDGHPPRGVFLPPVRLPRRMFAGSDLAFHAPLRIGKAVTCVSRIASVDLRSGKSGPLIFVRVAMTLSQGDAVCIEEEQTLVYREAGPAMPAVVEKPRQPPAEGEIAEEWLPSSVELFRYSCATFNSHRIHYDLPYAKDEEGYPALVVHGPLIATRLAAFATRIAPGPLLRFTFRGEAPSFVDQPIRLVGRVENDACLVRAERADGVTAMSAKAIFTRCG